MTDARLKTYIIRAGNGPVKIGVAQNVYARLGELQTGNHEELRVIRIIAGNVENRMHKQFKAQRIRREWFEFIPEMLLWLPPEDDSDRLLDEYKRALNMPTPKVETIFVCEAQ